MPQPCSARVPVPSWPDPEHSPKIEGSCAPGVTKDRLEELEPEMAGGPPPDDLPAKESVVLHDTEGEKSLVILVFDSVDDYKRGDETLNAVSAGDTPGERTSVTRYDVAIRMTV